MLKRLAIAISLSTLILSRAWTGFLDTLNSLNYYIPGDNPVFSSAVFAALMINTVLLSLLWLGGATLAARFQSKLVQNAAYLALLLLFVNAVNIIRLQFPALSMRDLSHGSGRMLALGRVAFVVFCILVLMRFGLRPLSKIIVAVLLIFSPLFPVLLAQVGWRVVEGNSSAAKDRTPAPYLSAETKTTRRILWLVFDEMDQRVAFSERPAGLLLPELDRLRGASLFAMNAYPPAGATVYSMPALITGRLVTKTEITRSADLLLTFNDQREIANWSAQPSAFSKARDLGHNAGLVGWYHPYCHLIGHTLVSCYQDKALSVLANRLKPATTENVLQSMRTQVESAFTSMVWDVPLMRRVLRAFGVTQSVGARRNPVLKDPLKAKAVVQRHLSEYLRIREEAKKRLTDPRLSLLLVHWPVPHPRSIYSRARHDYDVEGTTSYLDNLALVDRTLEEIRLELERAGQWENTTIILTSDHSWRVNVWETNDGWTEEDAAVSRGVTDRRIPFILKLAGHSEALEYEPPFNTVLTHDLILTLLRGELSDSQDVARWLDQHRSVAETPYGRSKTDK